jgi:Fe-S-cluster-containing dehydrogenase component
LAGLFFMGHRESLPTAWRRSLRLPWFEHRLVGRCDDPSEAVERIRASKPDVVLLDAEGRNGAATVDCRALSFACAALEQPAPVVALSPKLDDAERDMLLRAGAGGYILKGIDSASFAVAMRGFAGAPLEDDEDRVEAVCPRDSDGNETLLASRRDVLGWLGIGAAVAAMPAAGKIGPQLALARAAGSEESPGHPLASLPAAQNGESHVMRMQRELQRAMKRPMSERRWVMVIDTRKCIGCHACTVGCIAENQLPPGVVYRPVIDEEVGNYPHVTRRFLPRPCMHCDRPPCVPVCPVGATWKRSDGIVTIDYDKCIGCRYCITACPYSARTFDFGEYYSDGTPKRQPYEEQNSPEYDGSFARKEDGSPVGNARKCHFCIHRLNVGQLPACVTTCIGHATYFGDANDENSLVSELARSSNAVRLKEELGTKPKVYYLV